MTDPHLEPPVNIIEIVCLIGLIVALIIGCVCLVQWCEERDEANETRVKKEEVLYSKPFIKVI